MLGYGTSDCAATIITNTSGRFSCCLNGHQEYSVTQLPHLLQSVFRGMLDLPVGGIDF